MERNGRGVLGREGEQRRRERCVSLPCPPPPPPLTSLHNQWRESSPGPNSRLTAGTVEGIYVSMMTQGRVGGV